MVHIIQSLLQGWQSGLAPYMGIYGEDIFFSIAIIIITASILGFISRYLRQPLIPAYVLAGLIIGPLGLGLVTDFENIKTLSEIGIAFLLFVVGLELDFKKLRDIGLISSVGGTGNGIERGVIRDDRTGLYADRPPSAVTIR